MENKEIKPVETGITNPMVDTTLPSSVPPVPPVSTSQQASYPPPIQMSSPNALSPIPLNSPPPYIPSANQLSTNNQYSIPIENFAAIQRRYSVFLDQITPLQLYRWLAFALFALILVLRVFLIHGFYIVLYVLFIFLLNQFILFLQPKDRSMLQDSQGSSSEDQALPTVVDADVS